MSRYGYMESAHSLMPEDDVPCTAVKVTRDEIQDLLLLSNTIPKEGDTLRVDIWYLGVVPPTLLVDDVPLEGAPIAPQIYSFSVDASKRRNLGLGNVPFTRLEVCLLDGRGEVIPAGYTRGERYTWAPTTD